MMRLMQLEREVKACAYTCEIYSHGSVYGFCTYIEDEGHKQLVWWDFGFDGVETAECFAIASIIRCTYGVEEHDYGVLHDDDVKAHCNDCNFYRPC